MDRRKRNETALAVCLIGLAGYVDALGFISLRDLFISFMSGNSTEFVVRATQGSSGEAARPAALIGVFVLGAMAGSTIGRLAGRKRPPAVLAAVALTLAAAALTHLAGPDFAAALVMALAMGMLNGVFEGKGGISAVTYVTGTLVKLGQQLVAAAFGGPRDGFVEPLLLWLGLITGGAFGAAAWAGLRLNGLWIAVAAATALAIAANALEATEG